MSSHNSSSSPCTRACGHIIGHTLQPCLICGGCKTKIQEEQWAYNPVTTLTNQLKSTHCRCPLTAKLQTHIQSRTQHQQTKLTTFFAVAQQPQQQFLLPTWNTVYSWRGRMVARAFQNPTTGKHDIHKGVITKILPPAGVANPLVENPTQLIHTNTKVKIVYPLSEDYEKIQWQIAQESFLTNKSKYPTIPLTDLKTIIHKSSPHRQKISHNPLPPTQKEAQEWSGRWILSKIAANDPPSPPFFFFFFNCQTET